MNLYILCQTPYLYVEGYNPQSPNYRLQKMFTVNNMYFCIRFPFSNYHVLLL